MLVQPAPAKLACLPKPDNVVRWWYSLQDLNFPWEGFQCFIVNVLKELFFTLYSNTATSYNRKCIC